MKFYPVSLVGGVLGLVSLMLPWLTITVNEPGLGSISISGNGFELFELQQLLGLLGSVAPGLSTSIVLMILGVVLALIGAIVAFLHPAGGALLLGGGACGLAGALWFGSIISGLGGAAVGVSAGPGFGLFLALVAGIVSLAGFALGIPLGGAAKPAYAAYPGYPMYPGPYNPSYGYAPYGQPYGAPATASTPPVVPATTPAAPLTSPSAAPSTTVETVGVPPMPAPRPAVVTPPGPIENPTPPAVDATPANEPVLPHETLVCPTCGRRAAERFCTEDGTRMIPGPPVHPTDSSLPAPPSPPTP